MKVEKWYLKMSEGSIVGPMDKEYAKECSDLGMIFSEQIFSPKFVISSEVDELLAEMKSTAIMPPDQSHLDLKGLLLRAINTITLLSREKVIECSLKGGLFHVTSEMPSGVKILMREYDDLENHDDGDHGYGPVVKDPEGRECLEREYIKS